MKMGQNITRRQTGRHVQTGFSLLETLIVVAVVAVVMALGILGITRARASMRLSGAAREYASYIEKVRVYSIRRHADSVGQAANVTISDDRASYVVTLDFDGDGTMETRTVRLPDGVTFQTVEAIAFDWRGRTWNTVGGVTSPYAQVSITLLNNNDSVSVDVTGSGDVTIDSRVFDDAVPNVTLNVGDLASGAGPTPIPTAETAGATPTPYPSPQSDATPTPSPSASPAPSASPLPDNTPTPTPTPSQSPSPSPSSTPTPTPSPTPTPVVSCVVTSSPASVTLNQDGTTTVQISHNSSSAVIISGISSKPSDLQVTPNSQTVAANGTATFTLKSKKSAGTFSATFSGSCGEVVVSVTIQ